MPSICRMVKSIAESALAVIRSSSGTAAAYTAGERRRCFQIPDSIAQVQMHVSTSVQPSSKQEPRFLKFHTVLSPLLPPSSSSKSYKTPSLWILSLDICFFSLMTDYLHAFRDQTAFKRQKVHRMLPCPSSQTLLRRSCTSKNRGRRLASYPSTSTSCPCPIWSRLATKPLQ